MFTIAPQIPQRKVATKTLLLIVWLSFIAYILYLKPLDRLGTLTLI